MIVYEVNLELDAAIFAEYRHWLDEHMREIRALPGFVSAELFEPLESAAAGTRRALCVQYRLRSEQDLDRYLHEQAPRLRADGETRFGGRFSARRRILHSL